MPFLWTRNGSKGIFDRCLHFDLIFLSNKNFPACLGTQAYANTSRILLQNCSTALGLYINNSFLDCHWTTHILNVLLFWTLSILAFQTIKFNYFFHIYVLSGMYLSNKKWICISFGAYGPWFFYSTFWTRNGSKMRFQNLVFKGLKQ